MAKIAFELEQALAARAVCGGPGEITSRVLAQGDGWSVSDVVCTSGPSDRAFEELHTEVRIALVVSGSFQYRASSGSALMTPGSVLLGSPEQYFECSHDHGTGDRCIAFGYSPEYFSRVASEAVGRHARHFGAAGLPPLRPLAALAARACAGLVGPRGESAKGSWEEVSLRLAALAVELSDGVSARTTDVPQSTIARVTRAVRKIESRIDAELTLETLAGEARLSPYHFLRTFERLTGLTPHQYVLRTRLREAARRLATEKSRVIDIALDCGFGDVSNFNRAFRAEFGGSPRVYRTQYGAAHSSSRRSWAMDG